MGVKFGTKEGTPPCQIAVPSVQRVAPGGEKPQNRPLSDLNTGALPVKKTQRFWPRLRREKSEPHQTWLGDRGHRARSCTSKTFGGLTHSFAATGAENLGITRRRQLKIPMTP